MRLIRPTHAGGPRVRLPEAPTPAQLRTNAAWLRDQIEALQLRLVFGPGLLCTADLCRCLAAIRDGREWKQVVE